MFDDNEELPRLDLIQGAHMGLYAEDLGGWTVKLTRWTFFPGDEEVCIDSIILGRSKLERLLKWVNRDRKAEHREKMKEILKVLE